MVKLTENPYWQKPQDITPEAWLDTLPELYQKSALLHAATQLAFLTGHQTQGLGKISCWQHGISMADSLLPLNVDEELLSAALLYPVWEYAELSLSDIQETLSKKVAYLLAGADKMEAVSDLHQTQHKSPAQIENCRKMLLAMVEDLRVVLLKLAERLHALRTTRFITETQQKKLGEEVFSIYAPLANRLGLGHLKWEMEDLAFRAISPIEYKNIAEQLDMKRSEREALIKNTLNTLDTALKQTGISPFELMGRAKHIYSIHKKMSRKGGKVRDLFDISAVRILVNSIEDCYQVLDLVQQHFEMIPKEFDDYISAPKPNGYQSIHTAVYTKDRHIVEIQIRTFQMHQDSELGVAAHWRYKEGGKSNQDYEAKIAWLREILSWQKEVEVKETPDQQVLADRVYVLTPNGDIVDLPKGATPLDFAYSIHTSIGHRCRGAKINGQMATLTTPLKMGDSVEVLTHKEPNPSRDWLNPKSGYLFTARARAKVAHWFREQDYDQHIISGKNILEKELRRLNLHDIDHETLAQKFDYEDKTNFYAALGSNELKHHGFIGRLEQWYKHQPQRKEIINSKPTTSTKQNTGILIEGVANLLTHLAGCCQPLPGDSIAGYISRHSIAIHKTNCASFLLLQRKRPDHVLAANWGEKQDHFSVTLLIEANDRPKLNNEIMHLMTQENLALLGIHTVSQKEDRIEIEIYTRVQNLSALGHLIGRIKNIPNILKVYRK